MKIGGGYFILSRQMFDSVVMDWNPIYFKLWVWLIGRANHKNTKAGGRYFKVGEVFTSYEEMRNVASYKIGYRVKKPSKDVIRNFCEALTKHHMATTTKTTRGFIISIDNYSKFQDPKNYEYHNEDNNKTTMRQQLPPTIYKNEKNDNKKISVDISNVKIEEGMKLLRSSLVEKGVIK